MDLVTVWYVAIALLWLGFLLLEGFDFGVAALLPVLGRTPADRTLLLRTIGPVWDGNEVWLITAIGATFAAFPAWYAGWLSSAYLLFVLILFGLIARAVAFEWRHARHADRWEQGWTRALTAGSVVAALGIGAALGVTTMGLPIGPDGVRVGGPLSWLGVGALLGAVAVLAFSVVHGALFLSLRLTGPLQESATALARRLAVPAAVPLLGWALWAQLRGGGPVTAALLAVAVAATLGVPVLLARGRAGWAFGSWSVLLAGSLATVMAAAWPVVLPSTLDPAFDLTAQAASVSSYTLTVMTVVTCVGLPAVLLYQGWTYWVFRHRVTAEPLPVSAGSDG